MDANRFARVKAILLALEDLPAERRQDYLETATAGDAELRAEVESLLAQPTGPLDALESGALHEAARAAMAESHHAAPMPEAIGPYRILDKLGEGGMGLVYRAEQTEPIRREVALKLIRVGADSERIVSRFASERQTLALMDHPNIARVLDAGSDDGRPYFVMELVAGDPITTYVERRRLKLDARIRLFQAVCRGVQHAHQKGVIHRDLKPSNILISTHDGRPIPKIIDFGIAKAIGDQFDLGTLTQEGQLIGTLEYMSPEQARGGTAGLDTRSDVYSLGVVLYQLVAGRLPYETRGIPITEALRAIRETGPASLRSTSTSLRAGADLETILGKALEKDPERRYSGPGDLADDLERYLRSEPIQARPPSTVYQLRKMVARNRGPFMFATSLFVLLAAFAVVMSFQAAAQKQERERAEAEAIKSRTISDFLQGMLAAADPAVQGREVTVHEMLDIAAQDIGELQEQPDVQASLHETLGRAYAALARYEEAEEHLERALALNTQIFGHPHDAVATSRSTLAAFYLNRNVNPQDLARADSLAGLSLAEFRALHGENHAGVAGAYKTLGLVAYYGDHYAAAESLHTRAVEIARTALGPDHPDVAAILGNLAYDLFNQQKREPTEAAAREALSILQASLGPDHTRTADAQGNLAFFLTRWGAYAEAESLYRASIETVSRIRGDDHPAVAGPLTNLSRMLQEQGHYQESLPLVRRAVEIRSAALGDTNFYLATDYNNLAMVLDRLGQYQESEPYFLKALDIYTRTQGPTHRNVLTLQANLGAMALGRGFDEKTVRICSDVLPLREEVEGQGSIGVGVTHHSLATALNRLGRFEEAREHARLAEAAFRSGFGERHHNVAFTLLNVGQIHERQGRSADAETTYLEAVDLIQETLGEGHALVGGVHLYLGRLYRDWGRPVDARRSARIAVAADPNAMPKFPVAESMLLMSDLAFEDGDAVRADSLATAGLAVFDGIRFNPDNPRYALLAAHHAVAVAATGSFEPLLGLSAETVTQALTHPGNSPTEQSRLRRRLAAALTAAGQPEQARKLPRTPEPRG